MALYRAESWEASYAAESVYGAAPDGVLVATQLFGVFNDATMPDPEFEHVPYWAYGDASLRNYYIAYKGVARLNGSIPDIVLLDGRPLFLPLASAINHGAGPPYVHTINETVGLSSIRVVMTNVDTGAATGLVRWFSGGKVNRATYHCDEGGMLMMSLDEILFGMLYYKDDDSTNIVPWYDAQTAKQSLNYPTTEPYYFSQAAIKFKLAKNALVEASVPIRNFRLEVNNNLEPKYYLATGFQEKVPYEIYEGRREYRLAMLVDLIDRTSHDKNVLFLELLNQGMNTTFMGSAFEITFTRGANDYIKFETPAAAPAAGGDAQGGLIVRAPHNIINVATEGLVSVPLEIMCRSLKVTVSDGLIGTSYPV